MTVPPLDWPEGFVKDFEEQFGRVLDVHQLQGVVLARVWRAQLEKRTVVVKKTGWEEAAFFRMAARSLREAGVGIPSLEWVYEGEEDFWLVLEYVPIPLTKDRWIADPEVLRVLGRLHRHVTELRGEWISKPTWPDNIGGALSMLPASERANVHSIASRLQERATSLFNPECWISGDPNPTNWQLRANGEPVLVDWEYFGRGTPALDLAITVPGLGNEKDYRQVAGEYLRVIQADAGKTDELTQRIALAKASSVLQFLGHYEANNYPVEKVSWILAALPTWLEHIVFLCFNRE